MTDDCKKADIHLESATYRELDLKVIGENGDGYILGKMSIAKLFRHAIDVINELSS